MRETCNYKKEIHKTSSLITCDYHENPVIFAKKIITKHDQNEVKSELNNIPAKGEKMKWLFGHKLEYRQRVVLKN